MKVIWKGGTPQGGMAQWALFGVVAVVVGLVACVLAALGLVVGVLLAGFIAVAAALASRRRGRASPHAARGVFGGRAPEGDCVDLDRDSYTVRLVESEKPQKEDG